MSPAFLYITTLSKLCVARLWQTVVHRTEYTSTNHHHRGRCWQTLCLYQVQSCSVETDDSLSCIQPRWYHDIQYYR